MSKLAIALPITFGIMACGATLGLDFYKKQTLADDAEYSVAAYIKDATGSFKARAKEVIANRTMTDFLGEAPEGWTKRAFVQSDMDILRPASGADVGEVIPATGDKEKSLTSFYDGVALRGAQVGGNTFEKDGTVVIVLGTFLPAKLMTGFGGKQLGMMADMMNMSNMGDDFAIVRGLKFEEPWDQRDKLVYRRFAASLSSQIQLSVLTNSHDDAEVMQILASLDITSLNQMLVEPIPKMGENDILLLASAGDEMAEQALSKPTALDETGEKNTTAEENIALEIAENDQSVPLNAEAEASFADRLSGFFGSDTAVEKEEAKPKRMVCTTQQGFKRCAFPTED